MGLVALVLRQLRDRVSAGGLFALYLVLAGIERFLVEFLRATTRRRSGLTTAQLVSRGHGRRWRVWLLRMRGRQRPPDRSRSDSACSSSSCWTERWWPPGTTSRRLVGAAVRSCSVTECW